MLESRRVRGRSSMAVSAGRTLGELSALLDNYWVRSQLFRTLQFASTLCAGLLERYRPHGASRLDNLSYSISNMRVMLRLMDDIPALASTLRSWMQTKVCMCVRVLKLSHNVNHRYSSSEYALL